MRKLASEELYNYAVRYLSQRSASSEELKGKLRPRAATPADVDAAIARLKDVGYLDDRKFAESFASGRVENLGFGRMRVLTDLRARRVSGKLAEKAVERAFEGKAEAELIDAFIERRLPSLRNRERIEGDRELARAYRRLRRAGFTSGAVLAALRRLAAHPESIEDPGDEDEQESD
ncbi:MAG TPA: regulatory protein RecX [Bryobacteraceae bacterium]|nr:regulatory protein RecX [Bryobacteraceae bacterium]